MKTMLIPILTVAAVSSSALKTFADLERKDSSQFDYKYEMLKLPTAEDIDGNGKYDFIGGGDWLELCSGANTGACSMVISGSQSLKADAGNTISGSGVASRKVYNP